MKLFKSLFSIIFVLTMLLCVALPAYASGDTYSIEVPDGFSEFSVEGQAGAWKNADGSIIINLSASENTSNVKVNPNDAGASYMTSIENEMKASVTENKELSGEVVTINSSLLELGEHDAIRTFMQTKYTFENGEMTVYQVCYLFETQNYIHAFVITGDEDISEFSDDFIKTVKINDEAIALRDTDTDNKIFGGIIGKAILGGIVGVFLGVALVLIKKFTGKKPPEVSTVEEVQETTPPEEEL